MTHASSIVAELDRLYTASVQRLRRALVAYINDGVRPDPASRHDGSFAYPEIRLIYRGGDSRPAPSRSSPCEVRSASVHFFRWRHTTMRRRAWAWAELVAR